MTFEVTVATVSKAGRTPAENEDAVAVSLRSVRPDQPDPIHRVVVADGASESYLAQLWARQLVQVVAHGPEDPAEAIARARDDWPGITATHRRDRAAAGRPLEWFEDAALDRGAAATLLAVDVTAGRAKIWAMGDTCAFHLPSGGRVTSFPLDRSSQFDSSPPLVTSRPTSGGGALHPLDRVERTLADGDRIVVATDAAAAWAMARSDASVDPWTTLCAITGGPQLERWAQEERAQGRLRNDDTTVVQIATALPHG